MKHLLVFGLALCCFVLSGCALIAEPYGKALYIPLEQVVLIEAPLESVKPSMPESVLQGDFFEVVLVEPADTYFASFSGKEYHFSKRGSAYYGLIPVSYSATPEKTTLKITAKKGNVLSETTYPIEILAKKFDEQSLVVTTSMQQTRSQENLNLDARKVLASKQERLSYPLWKSSFMEPVEDYRLSTSFGLVRKINGTVSGRHSGMDMAAPLGTPVYAVNDGFVRLAETLYVTGNTIVIDHGMALYSGYGHLDTLLIKAGDYVTKGQQIATVGTTGFSTGPHLHFTFTIGTTFVNPEIIFGQVLISTPKGIH